TELFSVVHGLLRTRFGRWREGQPPIAFEIIGRASEVRFRAWVASRDERSLRAALRGAYPGVEFDLAEAEAVASVRVVARARLVEREELPIGSHGDADGLALVVASLASIASDAAVTVRLVVRPKPRRWSARARARAQTFRDRRRGRGFGVAQQDRARAQAIEEKAAEAPFDACLEVASAAATRREATEALESTAATFAVFAGANRLVFSKPRRVGRDGVSRRRRFPLRGAFVLTAPELATLWHLPREPLPRVERVLAPKLAAPVMSFQEWRVIGSSSWGAFATEIGLSIPDSRHLLHILGAPGTGTTTVLMNLSTHDT